MFRTVPVFGADQRAVAEVLRGAMNGKTNNHGTITLATGNATTTTLYDERISPDSKIILIPFSDAAEADSAPYGAFSNNSGQTAGLAVSTFKKYCFAGAKYTFSKPARIIILTKIMMHLGQRKQFRCCVLHCYVCSFSY